MPSPTPGWAKRSPIYWIIGWGYSSSSPERRSTTNIVERALKKAILNRKNALFYRTLNGARVGDLFMSLI
jgi:hypothetical protein